MPATNNLKVCPSGHQIKEVPIIHRKEEQRSGCGRWTCSSCKNDTLGLEGTRFRCDHHKVKNQLSGGSVKCDYDLCGECFYGKLIGTDINDNTEKNAEYRKSVIENIKELLLEHPNGIFDRNFTGVYRDAFGETIHFQKLGYPAHKSNKSKFLESLTGSILKMEYSSLGLYIKPSKTLLSETAEIRIDSLSLFDAQELPNEDLPNQSVRDIVYGVRKQVCYPVGLEEGSNLDVIVTEVVSPAKFWFQLKGEETSDAVESLMVDMESFYRNQEEKQRLDSANRRDECKPGMIMAAPFKQQYDFHRVHVNKICQNTVDKVEVFYLDYGTIGRIPISRLRTLPEIFSRLPAQALEGKLWGLAIPHGCKTWPKEAARRFLKLMGPVNAAGFGCFSLVKRIQTESRILHLELIDAVTTRSSQGLCINELLVQEGFAKRVDSAQLIGEHRTWASSVGSLVDDMQSVYDKETASTFTPRVGKPCAARYSVDRKFYRALIIRQASSDQYEVQFVDFGNSEVVDRCQMRELLDTFRIVPAMAVKVDLNRHNIDIENNDTGIVDDVLPSGGTRPLQSTLALKRMNQCNEVEAGPTHEEEVKGIVDDRSKKAAISANKKSVIPRQTKICISRVYVDENLSVNLLIDEGKIWLSSGDISLLMPTWRRKDLLAKMIEVRQLSISSLDIGQESDKFEQIMNLGLKPTENSHNVQIFKLYPVGEVPKLVAMFNKDAKNAKKIIEAVKMAADKVMQDYKAS